ncbi:MAG: peroxiredoxin-like family protein [Kofleriaceae bacterium]|nr:peroxiredoxin-like family protein [Kofleriaceae bacterium]
MTQSPSPVAPRMFSDRVDAFHTQLAAQVPADMLGSVDAQITNLGVIGAGAGALKVGDAAPSFDLPDARGGRGSLDVALRDGPVVLVFYRGQWCPYCDLQLRAYQEVLPRIRALGATMVAVSPQTPDESLSTAEKRSLAFAVLSDRGNEVARRYGLVFRSPAGLDAVHRGFGIDLARSNGDDSNELPVPGVFIIGRDRRIAFRFVEPDYRVRLEPAALLAQLESMSGK